ncbi:MAG: asparagine synthetase B [Spirulina sp. SIO3F2]|nr:asparagine synthetase B [Spirulina sp. SIO3F2]
MFNRDGQPVDRNLLDCLVQTLKFRGPDAQNTWQEKAVGLGHTLLAITLEATNATQPLTIDDQVYLVADIRLDGREALQSQLHRASTSLPNTASDAQLFLHAYLTWDTSCLSQLQGDFCFILWDKRQQRLWCGRDQLGIRPLYYSAIDNALIISNTLRCIQQHPQVSSALNESAIADFLLFGFNHQPETTTFADIQRLPPGHTLIATHNALKIERYWQLPVPKLCRYRQPRDYIAQFQWHLDQAVRDRTRLPQAAVFLSGGLDSAAMAASALAAQPDLQLQGLTVMYEHLIPDSEPSYAQQVAQSLNIPLDFLRADEAKLCAGSYLTPEPSLQLFPDVDQRQYRWAAQHARVVLYGQGGDEGMRPSTVRQLWGRLPWLTILNGIWQTYWCHGYWPHWGTGLRGWGRQKANPWHGYPSWLNPDIERRLSLRDRWLTITQKMTEPCPHRWRSQAYESLLHPLWQLNFESNDAGVQGQSVAVMFPYLDLRLLDYLLSLPPYPWFRDKLLAREALRLRPQIPRMLIERPKTPLGGHPFWAHLQRGVNPWQGVTWGEAIADYVAIDALNLVTTKPTQDFGTSWAALRPIFLQQWLAGHNVGR